VATVVATVVEALLMETRTEDPGLPLPKTVGASACKTMDAENARCSENVVFCACACAAHAGSSSRSSSSCCCCCRMARCMQAYCPEPRRTDSGTLLAEIAVAPYMGSGAGEAHQQAGGQPGRGGGRAGSQARQDMMGAWEDRSGQHQPGEAHTSICIENSVHETENFFGPFRSFQLQAESGGCVVLSGHLAAMMGPPGGPGDVMVGYPPRTPAQARVCTTPGDVPTPCPRGPRGYRSMVRVANGSAIQAAAVCSCQQQQGGGAGRP
jgi:hypothetical protein